MKAAPLELPDGRTLHKRRGAWMVHPDGMTVEVARTAAGIRVTDPYSGKVVHDGPLAARAATSKPAATKPAATKPAPAGAGRWQTYNEFVDVTMRELSEAELRVWLILFRDVRDGLARAGMSDIARRAGLSRRGVVKAVGGLKKRRLIEVASRGSVNGSTNAYRVYGATLGNRGSLPLGNPECRT